MAASFKINFRKSKIFSPQTFTADVLKQFEWRSEFINILNIPFGSKQEISSVKISSVKNILLRLKKIHSTFDAKSVTVKMKIMPLLSFVSPVHLFPNSMIYK